MHHHGVDPHRLPRSGAPDRLFAAAARSRCSADAIKALPGRKFIFTNGTREACRSGRPRARHPRPFRGHLRHRRGRFRAEAGAARPTTSSRACTRSTRGNAAMFEDLPRNLTVPTPARHEDRADRAAQSGTETVVERWERIRAARTTTSTSSTDGISADFLKKITSLVLKFHAHLTDV